MRAQTALLAAVLFIVSLPMAAYAGVLILAACLNAAWQTCRHGVRLWWRAGRGEGASR